MYIYNFLNDLDLLKNASIPGLERFPKENIVYYGYCQKEDIPIDQANSIDDGKNYLVYSTLNDTKKVNYILVDIELEYINLLNNESCTCKSKYLQKRDSAFLESVWLFDEFACLKNNPFFDADLSMGFQALEIYYNLSETDTPLLDLFDNNPIKRDIFFAQFNYFVKKYVKHKLGFGSNKITNTSVNIFKRNLHSAIIHYDNLVPDLSKILYITYENNFEFETFLQQIHTLDEHYVVESKDLQHVENGEK